MIDFLSAPCLLSFDFCPYLSPLVKPLTTWFALAELASALLRRGEFLATIARFTWCEAPVVENLIKAVHNTITGSFCAMLHVLTDTLLVFSQL
jgi:hypothetical protein